MNGDKMKCSICGKEIEEGEDYNCLLGMYSHTECDKKIMEKIEKKIKTFNRSPAMDGLDKDGEVIKC